MASLTEIVTYIITTFVGALSGWVFGRRKYNAEVKGADIQNFDAALDAYKKMYEDMITDLKTQNTDLKEEVNNLKIEVAEYRKQIITLTNFVLTNTANLKGVSTDDVKSIIDNNIN